MTHLSRKLKQLICESSSRKQASHDSSLEIETEVGYIVIEFHISNINFLHYHYLNQMIS